MMFLASSLADATVVLGIGFAACTLLRHRSASVRHAILTAAVWCAVLMPILELVLPQVPVLRWPGPAMVQSLGSTLGDVPANVAGVSASADASAGQGVDWLTILAALWALTAFVTLAGLVTGLVRLRRLRRRCTPVTGPWRERLDALARECGVRRSVTLLQSDDPSLLVTAGVFRPDIILPAEAAGWTDARRGVVLRHELAHIKRGDAAIQLLGEVLRVMQPINPLVWLACRRLRQDSECACDDAVLGSGVPATDYATHLFDVAAGLSGRQARWASALTMAHPSTLERRIVAMLQTQKDRRPCSMGGWALVAGLAMAASLPLAAIGVGPQSTPEETAPTAASLASAAAPAGASDLAAVPAPLPQGVQFAGRVQDQTGGVMPGVTVTVSGAGLETPYVAVTNAPGAFEFHLPAARYEVAASLAGFATSRFAVDLSAGTPVELTVTMSLGTLSEEINVACSTGPRSLWHAFFPVLSARELPAQAIRVGGQVKPPKKTSNVSPVCPAGGVNGDVTVWLEGHIGTDGRITDLTPAPAPAGQEDPPAWFIESTTQAVSQWEFTPTLLNGGPVEVTITVKVNFTGS